MRGTKTLGSNSDHSAASTGLASARPISNTTAGDGRGSRLRATQSPPASITTPTLSSTSAPGPGTFAAGQVGTPATHCSIAVPT